MYKLSLHQALESYCFYYTDRTGRNVGNCSGFAECNPHDTRATSCKEVLHFE